MKNITETRFNESVLACVWTWKCHYKDALNLKLTEEKYDNIRKHHGNGRSAPCPTPHCIKMFNILFKNLQIGMKIHICIAKWFLTIQIRTIPYEWKSWLQYYCVLELSGQPTYMHYCTPPPLFSLQ